MRTAIALIIGLLLAGCADLPKNYKPAGFETWDETKKYKAHGDYIAIQLSDIEWNRFYKRFPEYWENIQLGKALGQSANARRPIYAAYNFRWTTLHHKKPTWNAEKIRRLDARSIAPGDTPFEIFYSLGPPERIIWDNDFEILFYKPDRALMMDSGKLKETRTCAGCRDSDEFLNDNEIISQLGLSRPKF